MRLPGDTSPRARMRAGLDRARLRWEGRGRRSKEAVVKHGGSGGLVAASVLDEQEAIVMRNTQFSTGRREARYLLTADLRAVAQGAAWHLRRARLARMRAVGRVAGSRAAQRARAEAAKHDHTSRLLDSIATRMETA